MSTRIRLYLRMRVWVALIIGLALLAVACKKEQQVEVTPDYEQGIVLAGTGAVLPRALFDTLNALSLSLDAASSMDYYTARPQQDVPGVIGLLNQQPYLTQLGWTYNRFMVKFLDPPGKIWMVLNMWEMDRANQEDFLQDVADSLQLEPGGRLSSYLRLRVPVGKEKEWEQRLLHNPFFKRVELNYHYQAID